jgi:metallo-beta-lactamase class B
MAAPAKIFDNLAIVGTAGTSAAVIETSDGLILLDALWPGEIFVDMIEYEMRLLGYDPADIRILLISHGHPDHSGCGRHFIEKYGAVPYMGEVDYHFNKEFCEKAGTPQWVFDYEVDHFIDDGDVVALGDTSIKVFSTPGHTPGGLSFIVPVYDQGRPHTAALWGGSAPPPDRAACEQYLQSLTYWRKVCIENGVDAEFTTHPILNNGIERMEVMRNRIDQIANPFVIGTDAYIRFTGLFEELVTDALKKMEGK